MSDSTEQVSLGARVERRGRLSGVQQGIWTSQLLAPRAPLANMATAHRIGGPLDPETFVEAVDAVVRAADALRTVVDDRPGRVAEAVVLHRPPARTSVVDLDADDLDAWIAERVAVPLDATTSSYDSVLLRHGDDDWTWWLDLHHVVTDAWSSMLVFDAVSATYAELTAGSSPSLELPSLLDHTIERSATELTRAATPTAGPGAIAPFGPRSERTTEVTRHDLSTAVALADAPERYRTLSSELTTTVLLAAATAATIARLDGRHEVVIGLPVHHRTGPVARRLVGPLMSIHPVTVSVDLDATFGELFDHTLRQIMTALRGARTHAPPTDSAHDAVVNVQTAGYGEFAGLRTASTWHRAHHVEAAHPIRVHAYDYGLGPRLELDLNRSLSTDGSHLAFGDYLVRMLDAALTGSDLVVGDVELLDDDARRRLAALDVPALPDTPTATVQEQIARRLRSDPDAVVAIDAGAGETTASAFDRRAGRVAAALADAGIGRGDRVAIRMPRSVDVLVAVHGVLRRGAAFVMLDPADPAERHDTIVADAGVATVIDDVDDLLDGVPDVDPGHADVEVSFDDLAYVIYTSGSTGTPKGVPVSHRGLSDYLHASVDAYRVRDGSEFVMPVHSSLVFDLSITSLFLPHLVGGRALVVAGDPVSALSTIASTPGITVLKATPTQLEILARLAPDRLDLQVVVVGGEAFRRPVAEAVADLAPGVRIFNEYGPAEAVVGCMLHEWDPADDRVDVPIGVSSPGAELRVLDPRGRPTPPGAWGELYVWRPGMSTGYLGLPDETRAKFAPIDGLGERVRYRTGDRVRLDGDVLVYGGRIDDQLSVGGIRLEPGEIEAALVRHPSVTNAVVRVWSPSAAAVSNCVRCGLGTDVPGVALDDDGVCGTCREYDRIEPQTRAWFRTPADLDAALVTARSRARGDVDGLHLLSGGKDSTYALYQLVERGWRVHALTLDNGYISDGAKENIRRSVADLGITHEFVTTEAMDEIFRDSLERFANVCNGCYKTIYTLATARAHELGIPVIVTGLSRGQFFETRLVPHQFEAGRFDPAAIDRTVLQARRAYHATRDAVTELLPEQEVFERSDVDVLDEIEYLDFYRYVDVELAEMYDFLEHRAPWVRPDDTGRSTNCLVNVAGIHTHLTERGYHNYAEPYSWDVRLGHKTRSEALEELDDRIDPAEVEPMLDRIGYRPQRPEVLTAWYQTIDGEEIDARLLAAHLRDILPARSVPSAFVHVAELPVAASTKLDVSGLPAPATTHLGSAAYVEPDTPTEAAVAEIWERVLDVSRIGALDDFFDLGGASLAALETIAACERHFDVELPDALVFEHRRVRDLASAVDALAAEGRALAVIPPLLEGAPPPLSPGEEAMLFEYRAAPDDVRYNGMRHYRIADAVDLGRLRSALESVVERHQPLHTAYDEARTVLPTSDALSFELLPAGRVDAFVDRQRAVPFDLDHGPLLRVHARVDGGSTDVVVAMHHISVDAGTFDRFWGDVEATYHGRELPPLETTYAAHGAWQRGSVDAGSYPLHSPADAHGVELPTPAEVEPDGYLDRPASVDATELRAAVGTTPFAAALAAVGVTLSAFSRDGVVELGVTSSTEDHPATSRLVGYFLNSLPLTLEVDGDATLASIERAASDEITAVLPHRTEPFAEIVRAARRDGRRVPDISHMLAYERLASPTFGDAEVELRIVMAPTAVNDLTFFVHEQGDELSVGLEYRGSRVGRATAEALLESFDHALAAVCRMPATTVAGARHRAVAEDLVGEPLPPAPATPTQRFLELAADAPDSVATVDLDGGTTTYAGLARRAGAIADALAGVGVAEGSRVAICLPRSPDLLASIIGVHLAGATHVPIDPAVPAARARRLVGAARPAAAIVDAGADADGRFDGVALLDVHTITATDDRPVPSRDDAPDGDHPAYVIYTSGSTGEPAGVEVTHANLAASTAARTSFYGSEPPGRFLLTPSIGFDSSMVAIFWPLATGGAVVLPGDEVVHDVDRLGDLIDRLDATHLLMVPSLYEALLARRGDLLGGLDTAIVAGEACHPALVRRHHEILDGVALVNEYGPTEATVWAAAHTCDTDDDPVPIGRPIAGMRLRIADEHQRPLAAGSPGELLVAGPGVVRGYLSGRSDDAFVDDGEHRWYRTGDLVRLDDRGRIEFLGRVDDQLNVGGLRIEPLEIESVIAALDGVDDVVVTAARVDGRDSIVAHVVGDATRIDHATVRDAVAHRLGAAAAPRRVVHHASLPRTANGKLDRTRARELPAGSAAADTTPAQSGTVHDDSPVVGIWNEALGRDDLGPDSDFFEAGGDSLAAVAIVSALGDLVRRDVPVATLLTSPTPRSMANTLGIAARIDRSAEPEGTEAAPVVTTVTLRTGEPGGPVVMMTPAWDSVMGYHALANAFPDDVRVVAVVVTDVDRGSSLVTVPELGDASIDVAVDALTALDTSGSDAPGAPAPLVVLGWSIGGVAAFDLGRRLAERGVEVDSIALVDTFFPGEHHHLWSNRWWKYKSLLRSGSFGEIASELATMGRRRVDKLLVRAGRRLLAWGGQPAEPRRVETTGSGVPRTALDGDPVPTDLPVHLFAANTTNPDRTINRWRTVSSDLRIVPIVGRHRGFQSVMGADRVQVIADELLARLPSVD